MESRARKEGGWTFLETLISIAVVVALTGTVGIVGFRIAAQAKRLAARSQIESYALALEAYALDCGRVPTEHQGLAALWSRPVIEPVPERWDGPYVTKTIAGDPWGNPYEYRVPGPGGLPFGIRSYGADGRPGGDDDAEDIVSWSH